MSVPKRIAAGLCGTLFLIASCSDDSNSEPQVADTETETETETATETATETDETAGPAEAAAGIRLVSATDGAAIQADPPDNLVVLDVRTPEEFDEAHIDGAVLVDFYDPDFAEQLAELDPDVPYLLYCRSGNRSGQTTAIMEQLGFIDVADVDGGILAWGEAGLPLTTG
jgi:rhodanese-related sulfurtransferase